MSEERRKLQHEPGGSDSSEGKAKKMLVDVTGIVLLAGACVGGRYYRNHKYDSLAKCLASKQVRMYGLYWCPHCIEQKEEFGAAFHYVPYVECAIKGAKA